MYYLSAKIAVNYLTAHRTDHPDEMSEAAYFEACSRQKARLNRRSPVQVARAILAALHATWPVQWIVTGTTRRQNKAWLDILLRSDPRLLRDIGICTTGFGGFVLEDAEGQRMDLLAAPPAPPAPTVEVVPQQSVKALPNLRPIRHPRGQSPAMVPV